MRGAVAPACDESTLPRFRFRADLEQHLARYYGDEHVGRMEDALATPPRITTLRFDPMRVCVSLALAAAPALAGVDALVMELNRALESSGFRATRHTVLDELLVVPVSGPHVLHTEAPDGTRLPELVIDERCGEAVLRGADIFIPGVIGMQPCEVGGRVLVVVPRASIAVTKGAIMSGPYAGVKLVLAVGTLRLSRMEIFHGSGSGVAVTIDECIYRTPSLNNVLTDRLFLQNMPSLMAVVALDPRPEHAVIDMCASPGGKTTHVAARVLHGATAAALAAVVPPLGSTIVPVPGVVYAVDKNAGKVDAVVRLAERLGVARVVRAMVGDAAHIVASASGGDAAAGAPPDVTTPRATTGKRARTVPLFAEASFDRVVLDPPCSALGLRPRLSGDGDLGLPAVRGHAEYQRKLLAQAARLLRPGGVLVYSTCTINPEENEENVAYAVAHLGLRVVPLAIGDAAGVHEALPGRAGLAGCGLSDEQRALVRRFDPALDADCIGFFVAKLVRE